MWWKTLGTCVLVEMLFFFFLWINTKHSFPLGRIRLTTTDSCLAVMKWLCSLHAEARQASKVEEFCLLLQLTCTVQNLSTPQGAPIRLCSSRRQLKHGCFQGLVAALGAIHPSELCKLVFRNNFGTHNVF